MRSWGDLEALEALQDSVSFDIHNSRFLGTAYSLYCLGWASFPHKK